MLTVAAGIVRLADIHPAVLHGDGNAAPDTQRILRRTRNLELQVRRLIQPDGADAARSHRVLQSENRLPVFEIQVNQNLRVFVTCIENHQRFMVDQITVAARGRKPAVRHDPFTPPAHSPSTFCAFLYRIFALSPSGISID